MNKVNIKKIAFLTALGVSIGSVLNISANNAKKDKLANIVSEREDNMLFDDYVNFHDGGIIEAVDTLVDYIEVSDDLQKLDLDNIKQYDVELMSYDDLNIAINAYKSWGTSPDAKEKLKKILSSQEKAINDTIAYSYRTVRDLQLDVVKSWVCDKKKIVPTAEFTISPKGTDQGSHVITIDDSGEDIEINSLEVSNIFDEEVILEGFDSMDRTSTGRNGYNDGRNDLLRTDINKVKSYLSGFKKNKTR